MTLKHNLSTVLKVLNLYVGNKFKVKSGQLTPITPMHMEINAMIKELEQLKREQIPFEGKKWVEINEVLG